MFGLICTDVDGTLVDKNGNLLECDRQALKKAIDMGIKVAIVSGRFRRGVDTIVKKLNLPVWSTCFNGLYIEAGRDNVIYENTTSKSGMLKVLELTHSSNASIQLFGLDDWYAEKKDYYYDLMFKVMVSGGDHVVDLRETLESNTKIYKLLLKDRDINELISLKKTIDDSHIEGIQTMFSSANILEIIPSDADKSVAVEKYCSYLGLDRSQVIAFGDYDNDLGMLKAAGTSVAMGNGTPSCKEIATMITKPVTEGGISYALEQLLSFEK